MQCYDCTKSAGEWCRSDGGHTALVCYVGEVGGATKGGPVRLRLPSFYRVGCLLLLGRKCEFPATFGPGQYLPAA